MEIENMIQNKQPLKKT